MQSLQLWFAFDTDAIKDNPIPETPFNSEKYQPCSELKYSGTASGRE